jgi:hypothetical protein
MHHEQSMGKIVQLFLEQFQLITWSLALIGSFYGVARRHRARSAEHQRQPSRFIEEIQDHIDPDAVCPAPYRCENVILIHVLHYPRPLASYCRVRRRSFAPGSILNACEETHPESTSNPGYTGAAHAFWPPYLLHGGTRG